MRVLPRPTRHIRVTIQLIKVLLSPSLSLVGAPESTFCSTTYKYTKCLIYDLLLFTAQSTPNSLERRWRGRWRRRQRQLTTRCVRVYLSFFLHFFGIIFVLHPYSVMTFAFGVFTANREPGESQPQIQYSLYIGLNSRARRTIYTGFSFIRTWAKFNFSFFPKEKRIHTNCPTIKTRSRATTALGERRYKPIYPEWMI